MVKKKLLVIWDKEAKEELKKIYQYIKERSEPSAQKVRSVIIDTSRKLSEDPEIYEQDKYTEKSLGNIRSFIRWHYRITFQVTESQIIILAVTHTSKDPKRLRIIR